MTGSYVEVRMINHAKGGNESRRRQSEGRLILQILWRVVFSSYWLILDTYYIRVVKKSHPLYIWSSSSLTHSIKCFKRRKIYCLLHLYEKSTFSSHRPSKQTPSVRVEKPLVKPRKKDGKNRQENAAGGHVISISWYTYSWNIHVIVSFLTWSFSFCRAISFSCTSLLSLFVLSMTQSKIPWQQNQQILPQSLVTPCHFTWNFSGGG